MRALHLHNAGQFAEAERLYRQIAQAEPMNAEVLHLLGVVCHQRGRNLEALDWLSKAIAFDPQNGEIHNNLGSVHQALGHGAQAVDCHQKAIALLPDFAVAHYNLGNAFKLQGKIENAVACYKQAVALKPDYARAHNNLGLMCQFQGDIDQAIAQFRTAIAQVSDFAEAHFNLLEILEKSNRRDALREALSNAKRHCPHHDPIILIEAQMYKADKAFAQARTVLERHTFADPVYEAQRNHLLGQMCDRLGDVDAAFAAFSAANAAVRNSPLARRYDPKTFQQHIDRLADQFTVDWLAHWNPAAAPPTVRPAPVFMVGFPRSGTTLTDTILRSHKDIAVVEEMPMVGKMVEIVEALEGGYPAAMAGMDAATIEKLRTAYFTELDRHLEPGEADRTVIDKYPLNLVEAGLIHRVFPTAKFIFVTRHPCDCVLSCYMQNFELNNSMANFLDLGDSASVYDKALSLWTRYREVMDLPVYTLRYEDLVEQLEDNVRPLLAFLDLAWDAGVMDYIKTAQRRKIDTPSYDQVTQPLYTRARGRWEKYRAHLSPVLPVLLEWAARHGYGAPDAD